MLKIWKTIVMVCSLGAGVSLASVNNMSSIVNLETAGNRLTPEQIKAANELAGQVANRGTAIIADLPGTDLEKLGKSMSRRADDIANATIANERASVLKFLNIDPAADTSLYYFVSWSMPIEMLRAYVQEAMWSGGTLVFRGIPPNKTLASFLKKELYSLINHKGASAMISIDPRLFDLYAIKVVPTLVFSENRESPTCIIPVSVKKTKAKTQYTKCAPMSSDKYWKISGALTADYALREIINAGGSRAQVHLDAMAKAAGADPRDFAKSKELKPFSGNWAEAVTPEDKMRIKEAIDAATKQGRDPGRFPKGLEME